MAKQSKNDIQRRDRQSLKCFKCGHATRILDVKNYKSMQANKDIINKELNNYVHRWRKCDHCGSLIQTAEIGIEGTFIENNYEDSQINFDFYRNKKPSKK